MGFAAQGSRREGRHYCHETKKSIMNGGLEQHVLDQKFKWGNVVMGLKVVYMGMTKCKNVSKMKKSKGVSIMKCSGYRSVVGVEFIAFQMLVGGLKSR